MTDETDRRSERLKAALRDNLRRRKVQGRGRAEADRPAGATGADADRSRPDSDKTGL